MMGHDRAYLILGEPQHYRLFIPGAVVVRNPRLLPLAFGREIRRRRLALGLTLEQLAERSSLTPNYIGTVEHGQRDPSLSTILALARGLGVAPGEILGGIGETGALALEAARLIEAQPPDVQEAMLELLRSMTRRRRG